MVTMLYDVDPFCDSTRAQERQVVSTNIGANESSWRDDRISDTMKHLKVASTSLELV